MRKVVAAIGFVAVVLTVWVAGNLYLARRLVIAPRWAQPLTEILLWTIAALAVMPLVEPIAERLVGCRRARWIAWPGYLYMGLSLLLLVALGTSDLLLGITGAAFGAGSAAGTWDVAVARGQAVLSTLAALAAGGVALVTALRPPVLRRIEIPLERWPAPLDGFRIVQVSDVHIGAMLDRRFAEHVVDRVNELSPDLIAVTGDLVDGATGDLVAEVAPFSRLHARHGVFFVTGNHDYYSGADPWIAHVQGFGWRVLRNERESIGRDGAAFDLAGVDDHRANLFGGDHGEDVPRALAGRDPTRAVVLLAHDPTTFKKASRLGVDLQISGHTHGGQIWPFGYLVRLLVTFVEGEYERNGAKLIVSRGTGFWGPPMRLASRAEILEIVLRATASHDEAAPTRAAS
jgi:uncharacterized protein